MIEPEPRQSNFGQRHNVLIAILLVFGVGFLIGGLVGGVAGATGLLVLSFLPALIITILQSIRSALRSRSLARAANASDAVEEGASLEPFHRRLASNFEKVMDALLMGWIP